MKRLLTTLMVVVASVIALSVTSFAGDKPESLDDIRNKLNNILGSGGNAGTEFYLSFPPCYEVSGTNYLKLYVACPVRTKVRVEVEGKGFIQEKFTVANDVIDFTLAPGVGQVYSKPASDGSPAEQVYPQAAVHVKSGSPIVIYAVTRFDFTSDSFLAYPIQTFGKEYITASMADMSWMYPGLSLPSESVVVAPYDNTSVTITIGGNAVTKTGGGLKAGQSKTFSLNRGDVLAIGTHNDSKEGDLSGMRVVASKPVGVISGNQCANVPTTLRWCDYVADMELPTNLWGKTIYVPRHPIRKNSGMIKIFAKEPNTKVFRNGQYWRTIKTAGGIEGTGFIYERVDPNANNVGVFSADKPISITFFPPGQEDDGVSTDPDQVTIFPAEQYSKEILFCTPGIRGAKGFPRNEIMLTYQLSDAGTIPDDLEFGVAQGGKIKWNKLSAVFGSSPGDMYYAPAGAKVKYAHKYIVLPGDGAYAIRCKTPFGAISNGGSDYDSYLMPTAGALVIVSSDTIAPDPKWEVKCDGTVDGALVTDLPNDVNVRSNLSTIVLDPELSKNYTLEYDDFIPGDAVSNKWRLKVDDPDQDAIAIVTFTDRAGNDTTIQINYSARKVTIDKDAKFGLHKSGDVQVMKIIVKNEGTSDATISRLEWKGDRGQGSFDLLNVTLPFILKAGESKEVEVQFTAKGDGDFKDSIGVGDDCVFRYRRIASASVGTPIIAVSDIDFGQVVVNTTVTKTFSVASRGSVKLTVTGATPPTPNDNVFTPENAVSAISGANPLSLEAVGTDGDNIIYQVNFKPLAKQKYHAEITFTSDAKTVDNVCILDGEGVQPGLIANNIDFGRRRMLKGPYTKDITGTDAYVILTNTGNSDVTVKSASIQSGDAAQFENFDVTPFNNRTIKPGQSEEFKVKVNFTPQTFGNHQIVVKFDNDSPNQDVTSTIKGVGIIPKVKITDVNFGQVKSTGGTESVRNTCVISNYSASEWAYGDVLTVTDLNVLGAGDEISTDRTIYGTKGFTYDKATVFATPMVIQEGSSVTINNSAFLPPSGQNGIFTAQLRTVSDALEEDTSNWTGEGIPSALTWTLGNASETACVGALSNVMLIELKNTGDVPISTISSITLGGNNADQFTLESVAYDATKLPLGNGQSLTIAVRYTPKVMKAGTHTADLIVEVNSNGQPQKGSLTGTPQHFTTKLLVDDIINQEVLKSGTAPTQKIIVKMANPIDAGNLQAFSMNITFDNEVLFAVENGNGANVKLVGPLAGWQITNNVLSNLNGTLDLTVSGSSPLVGGNAAIAEIEFQVGLPKSGKKQYQVTASATTQNQCVDIEPGTGNIDVNPVCAMNLRHVNVSGTQFALKQVNPNPVTSSGTDIHFSVGFAMPTRVDIINSNGEIVNTLVNEQLNEGEYTLHLVPTSLSSGAYTIRMQSGVFTQTQPLIINK